MQKLTHRSIELLISILVDKFSRIFGFFIKPMSNISSGSLYERLNFFFVSVLLYKTGEIIYLTKERYPDVVGMGMCLKLRQVVEPPFMVGFGKLFSELRIFTHQFQKFIK